MSEPTVTVSVDRTSMILGPLVFSGTPGDGQYGLSEYQEPTVTPTIRYATPSDFENDDDALGFRLGESILGWSFFTDGAASEQESRNLVAAVRYALLRISYEVTVTIDGSTPEVWTCKPGVVTPAKRTYADLVAYNPVFQVTVPCHPVRTTA